MKFDNNYCQIKLYQRTKKKQNEELLISKIQRYIFVFAVHIVVSLLIV